MMTRLIVLLTLMLGSATALATDYRIPDTFDVSHQSVSLKLDPDADGYSGRTELTLTVTETSDALALHWSGHTVTDIELKSASGARALTASDGDFNIHTLSDGQPFAPGEYALSMNFTANYSTDALGLYKASEGGRNYLFTQFEAMFARRAFPMVDEPDSKITWDVTISAPSALKVAVNTPVIETSTQGDWTTRRFKTTPPMPSYLLALIVGDFDVTPIQGAKLPINVYSTKGTGSSIGYSAKVTPAILVALEDYFGIDYPYEKLDFVAVPDFTFGAMENAGLITYRSELLLNGNNPSPNSAFSTALVIAHELAHQWYGNLVTMAWWDDLWLNEAFASWMAYKVVTDLHPEFRSDLFLPQADAFPADALGATRAIRKEIRDEEDVTDGLGLNYSKGHSILNMLEQSLGEDAFRSGIRQYMKTHQWGNTIAADLWAALEAEAEFKVGEVAETFLNQPGYPLIQIESDGTITQRRFENAGAGLAEQSWRVPMAILVGRGDETQTLNVTLTAARQPTAELADADWLFPAAGGNGYYVWYTGEQRYQALLTHLVSLNDREKLALLVNGNQLLAAGVVGMDQHMALLDQVIAEPNEELAQRALEDIRDVAEMYRGSHLEPALRDWVSKSLDPWYDRLGATPRAADNPGELKLRARVLRVLAQLGNSTALRAELSTLADQWLQDANSVDSGIALEALRMNAMFAGNADVAQRYLDTYSNSNDAVVKSTLRSAMYFTDGEAVETVMAALAEGVVNAGDMAGMVSGLFYANADQEVLYQSYQKHFDDLQANLPEYYRSQLPQLTGVNCRAESLERQQAFYKERGDKFASSMRKSQEAARTCISTRNRELEAVDSFLGQP